MSFYEEQEILVLATNEQIKLVGLTKGLFDGENKLVEEDTLQVRTIHPRLKLHGIFTDYNVDSEAQESYFAFETLDNQLDFNLLNLVSFGSDEDFTYSFKQTSEIIPRKEVLNIYIFHH